MTNGKESDVNNQQIKVYLCITCFNGHMYNEEVIKVVDSKEKAEKWVEENPMKQSYDCFSSWNKFKEFNLE